MKLIQSLLCTAAVLLCTTSTAQTMMPETDFDPAIPTFEQVLGYKAGQRISSHHQMMRYFAALQQAAPERIKVVEYARSWEDRALIYAAIGNQEQISNLQGFADDMQRISDPRNLSRSARDSLLANLPASVWLEYSVHGNEISGTDAAMYTAYYLLAAKSNPLIDRIRKNTLVFIDPLQNPDGRERFTSRYYATVGMQPSDDRYSAEHNEPWPNGRTNHYLFDMNRDWLAITQPETKGRIAALNKFKPLVVVDLHEMGGDSSYYFAPAAEPFNPHMTPTQIDNMNSIGRNHANHFDTMGFDYFTREIFDAFYPGYGDSWPVFYGASASTYEVSSSRGEVFKRKNGERLHYFDTVQQHVVASLSTAEGTAINRQKLLKDFYQYQVDAIAAGKKSKQRVFILPNQEDRAGNHRLATLMAEHGVEVWQATEEFKACGERYTAGAYYIDSAQPRGRFVTTTFSDQVDMAKAFLDEQERRRSRYLRDQIYDVTGWSLPLMFNLQSATCDNAIDVASKRVAADDQLAASIEVSDQAVAYVVPWGDMSAVRFLSAALQQGIRVKSADRGFTLEGNQSFPGGSLVIEVARNDQQIASKVIEIAKRTGAVVESISSSWVIDGPSLGSGSMPELVAPKIAMAWDEPVSSTSAGNTRFVIERQMGYPVTAIRTSQMSRADLSRYHVIVLPNGYYNSGLASSLKEWVADGGILVTMDGATRFAATADNGLLNVSREYAVKEQSGSAPEGPQTDGSLIESKADMMALIDQTQSSPDWVSGVLANVEVDQEHWLTAGVKKDAIALLSGNNIYTPIRLDSGVNLAWFKGKDELLASGYLWEDNKRQLAYKPFLIQQPIGKGMVIAFTQEPTFRAYMDGLNVLFANTILRAPAHSRKLR